MPLPSDGNDRNGPEQESQEQPGKRVEGSIPSSASGSQSGENKGWIDSLARRSTGLPGDESKPVSESRKGDSNLWHLAGLGVQFAASTAIFAFIGNALDRKMGWSPWGLVSCSLLAVIGNLYLLIKETLKQDSTTTTTKPGAKNDSPQPGKRSPPKS